MSNIFDTLATHKKQQPNLETCNMVKLYQRDKVSILLLGYNWLFNTNLYFWSSLLIEKLRVGKNVPSLTELMDSFPCLHFINIDLFQWQPVIFHSWSLFVNFLPLLIYWMWWRPNPNQQLCGSDIYFIGWNLLWVGG